MFDDVVIASRLYARVMIDKETKLDQIAVKVLKQDAPDFLLPMKYMNIDGQTEVRFEIIDGVRFAYFNERMRKRDFARLLKHMLLPYRDCGDWFLDYHNLILDAQYIVLRRADFSVRYTYMPTREAVQSEDTILDFFESLIVRTELTDDQAYTMKLLRILKESNAGLLGLLHAVTQDAVEESVQTVPLVKAESSAAIAHAVHNAVQDLGARTANAVPQMHAPQQNTPKPDFAALSENPPSALSQSINAVQAARPGQAGNEFGKSDIQGALLGSLFDGDDDGPVKGKGGRKARKNPLEKADTGKPGKDKGGTRGGLFGGKKNQKSVASADIENAADRQVVQKQEFANFAVSDDEWASTAADVTQIDEGYGDAEDGNNLILQLEDAGGYSLPQTIELDLSKGYVTIGRYDKSGNAQCDFNFSASISFISRTHLRIEKQGDGPMAIDLDSSNGTFINGEQLVPNRPTPFGHGASIMFSKKYRVKYRVC